MDKPVLLAEATDPQLEFLSLGTKYRGFVGGYGSGKTHVGCMAMCIHYWQWPKVNQGYFAPSYPQIRDIFYPSIEEVSSSMGLSVEIKESNKEVHFYSGGTYRGTTICRSMDRPHTIVGFKIGHALVDELDTLPLPKAEDAWRKIIARMRYHVVGLENGVDVTTTPEGFRATHKLFVARPSELPDLRRLYGLVQVSTFSNSNNLPEDYIQSLISTYPAELVDAYVHGRFVNLTSGTVYRSYNREHNRSNEEIREREPLYVGMDFNVGNMAATVYVQRKDGWHAVAELSKVFDTPDMIRIIQERWGSGENRHVVTIYPDASSQNRRSSNASESDLTLLRQAGFLVRVNTSNPAVKDRVMSVNKAFEDLRLWVNDKTCPNVAKCLEQQAYDSNGEPDKSTGFDHQNDATGYPIAYEFPIVKPTTTTHRVSVR